MKEDFISFVMSSICMLDENIYAFHIVLCCVGLMVTSLKDNFIFVHYLTSLVGTSLV